MLLLVGLLILRPELLPTLLPLLLLHNRACSQCELLARGARSHVLGAHAAPCRVPHANLIFNIIYLPLNTSYLLQHTLSLHTSFIVIPGETSAILGTPN